MKLYFSRNPNPRLAVAVVRFLKTDIEFEFAEPMALGQSERYLPLNPNLLLPILERPVERFGRAMRLPAGFPGTLDRISGEPTTRRACN